MTIAKHPGQYWTGTSADFSGVSTTNLLTNTRFFDTTVRTEYHFDGSQWQSEFVHPYSCVVYKTGSTFIAQDQDNAILESSTEPATVIQAGIDYAAGKGILFIKNADYTCNALGDATHTDSVLAIPSNIEIVGESRDRTKLINGASMSTTNFIRNADLVNGNQNIIFRNIWLENSVGDVKSNVHMQIVKEMVWDNCYFKNGAGARFNFFITGKRNDVDATLIDAYVDETLVNNCIFESNTANAYDNFGGGLLRNSVVSNNIFFNSGGSASFAIRLMIKSILANNVSYDNTATGFSLEAGSDNVISNNIAHDCDDAGFKAFYVDGPPEDGASYRNIWVANQSYLNKRGFSVGGPGQIIIGNIARNNTVAGIDCDDADRCTIMGNHCYNNGTDTTVAASFRAGIRLSYTAHTGYTYVGKSIIAANHCYDDQGTATQRYGIREATTDVNNNYIFDNILENNATANLSIQGANTRKWNNVGYVTEAKGATSVANGGTISHGLATTPTVVTLTPSAANRIAAVTAVGATTFTVSLQTDAGVAVGSAETVYWRAEV